MMCLGNIKDLTISQDYQDIVPLIVLRLFIFFRSAVIICLLQNTREVCWPKKSTLLDRTLISSEASIDSIHFRVINVSVQSEAVTNGVLLWQLSSKAINGVLFVCVIIFKNQSKRF